MQSLAATATNSFPRVILSEVDNLFDLHSLVPRLSLLELSGNEASIFKLASFPGRSRLHTVCDQKLEAGTAWERG